MKLNQPCHLHTAPRTINTEFTNYFEGGRIAHLDVWQAVDEFLQNRNAPTPTASDAKRSLLNWVPRSEKVCPPPPYVKICPLKNEVEDENETFYVPFDHHLGRPTPDGNPRGNRTVAFTSVPRSPDNARKQLSKQLLLISKGEDLRTVQIQLLPEKSPSEIEIDEEVLRPGDGRSVGEGSEISFTLRSGDYRFRIMKVVDEKQMLQNADSQTEP